MMRTRSRDSTSNIASKANKTSTNKSLARKTSKLPTVVPMLLEPSLPSLTSIGYAKMEDNLDMRKNISRQQLAGHGLSHLKQPSLFGTQMDSLFGNQAAGRTNSVFR